RDSGGNPVTPELEISYTGRLGTSYKGAQPPTEVGTYSVIFRAADTDPTYIGRLAVNFEITRAQSGGGSGGGGYTPPTYKPDVPQPDEGGSVSVSPSRPERGDTVTVTPKPDEGYEVDEITVTDKDGKPVEVTKKPDGTYTFQQPNGRVTIEVTYKPIETPETPWNNPFTDVSERDWFYEAVRFVQENGLMNGYEDGRFGPNDTLSRAQLAQILFNKEGGPAVNYLLDFSDVADGSWYTEAVRWAASQGIVSGYGNGTFGPNDPITREQLAVMLWRHSGSPAATNKELHFNDESEISGYALE
ncbi:S-layer homology domain-containing protein, partial [Pseudoflavonifractor sp. 60]|uniref:S-layer homology domain-containing protein n=1 Tax=Pseudoflavonifractor sp. 60 TaxID=2304576 RepID=UPI0013717535